MLNSIIKDFALWLYSLFVELLAYAAKSLLGLMNTDLAYFESNVPVVTELYRVFVAIGWGLLIGNCIFQCLKAMFAGLGFETESPPILLVRTFLFGFLLFFSHQICEIALSIGQKITDLIGIPENVEITFPDKTFFTELSNSWLLIIIVGVLIGIQVLKLFFEMGERYAVVAVLTLFSPLAFAMGGSKSTKDICSGFIRTYASMILLLISNVLFLKLILSAMGAMPTGLMVLPWTVLIVGLAKTARKADNLLSKIGMNPTFTGDPLDHGTGRFIAMLAARSAINSAMHTSGAKTHNSASAQNSSRSGFSSGGTRNSTNGSNNTPPEHRWYDAGGKILVGIDLDFPRMETAAEYGVHIFLLDWQVDAAKEILRGKKAVLHPIKTGEAEELLGLSPELHTKETKPYVTKEGELLSAPIKMDCKA